MNNPIKKEKGITLIALVITIIVLIVLAGITLALALGNNGIINKATTAKIETDKAMLKEKLEMESVALKNGGTLEELEAKLEENGVECTRAGNSLFVSSDGMEYTILADGTILEGKVACLNIADGNVDLYSNGYIQYTGNLQAHWEKRNLTLYTGKYVITGSTTQYELRVCDIGTYDITLKDLSIDFTDRQSQTAFDASTGAKATDSFVNVTLEGNNYLKGNNAPGLGFVNATPNVGEVTNGSTLTIQGNGSLMAVGGSGAAGIGSGYTGYNCSGGNVANIIINSGNITAIGGGGNYHAAGIGGALYKSVNNIIINGGNINATGYFYGSGIGGAASTADNIIINGGNICVQPGNCGTCIGDFSNNPGKIYINGGNIIAIDNSISYGASIGGKCNSVEITGGTIKAVSKNFGGISCGEGGSITIQGGNILAKGKQHNIATHQGTNSNATVVSYIPKNGTSDLYLTSIKLQNVAENKKIESLTTSDNIEYGTKDMYTFEDDTSTTEVDETGMIYLYLPAGTRTITINVEGQSYSGTVETKTVEGELVTLNKV